MREILFRGKREDNGEWIFGYPIYDFADCTAKRKGKCVCNHNGELIGFIAWKDQEHEYDNVQVDPSTVGQYTVLTDKNGRKIFEGDIIRYADIYEYACYLESIKYPEEYDGVDFSDMWTVDEVVYCDDYGYPAFDLNKHDFEINGLNVLYSSRQFYFEVIGNIYDNRLEDFYGR